jgi:hypothetical protein
MQFPQSVLPDFIEHPRKMHDPPGFDVRASEFGRRHKAEFYSSEWVCASRGGYLSDKRLRRRERLETTENEASLETNRGGAPDGPAPG